MIDAETLNDYAGLVEFWGSEVPDLQDALAATLGEIADLRTQLDEANNAMRDAIHSRDRADRALIDQRDILAASALVDRQLANALENLWIAWDANLEHRRAYADMTRQLAAEEGRFAKLQKASNTVLYLANTHAAVTTREIQWEAWQVEMRLRDELAASIPKARVRDEINDELTGLERMRAVSYQSKRADDVLFDLARALEIDLDDSEASP